MYVCSLYINMCILGVDAQNYFSDKGLQKQKSELLFRPVLDE